MRSVFLAIILCCCAGCIFSRDAAIMPMQAEKELLEIASERNLAGNVSAKLSFFAHASQHDTRWGELSDLARFARESADGKSDELARELLWESAMLCYVQFCDDPAAAVRKFCTAELKCNVMQTLSEKYFLDSKVWKNAAEERRDMELENELSVLLGDPLPFSLISSAELVMPGAIRPADIPAALPVTEDPAEALLTAGVLYLMPDEIRRQKIADTEFNPEGVIKEVIRLAASYALFIDVKQLTAAEAVYTKDMSAENLLRYRKWYYRAMQDISLLPAECGNKNDREFINAMLLLQQGF